MKEYLKNDPDVQELKKEMGKTADMVLDGLDIVLDEMIHTGKKVWKETEDTRNKAVRGGLCFARKILDKAEKKFVDKL